MQKNYMEMESVALDDSYLTIKWNKIPPLYCMSTSLVCKIGHMPSLIVFFL